jgi:flagellar basal-body rod protein FlgF
MDRLSYTAFTGMRAAMSAQAVRANNIANASTVGYRRDFAGAVAAAVVDGVGTAGRLQANERALRADSSAGSIIQTGRDLDIAMEGAALLAVQAPEGGEAYTRRGDLRLSVTGVLENGDGHPVLGTSGPVSLPPADRVVIGADGTISIQPRGAPLSELTAVDRLKLVSPDPATLGKRPDALLRPIDGTDAPLDPAARLASGALETSNVNLAGEFIAVLENARAFELQVGLLTTARDLDQASSALLRHEA